VHWHLEDNRPSEVERFNDKLVDFGHPVFFGQRIPRVQQFGHGRLFRSLYDEAAFAVAGDDGFVAGQGKLTRNADRLTSSIAEDADGTGLGGGCQRGFLFG
jgi:hypothetical protein